ncbi:unnamed protein product [Schistosoma curassoni]|uniref:Ovule protein n=1 Tax=Schistosoma curassoni TaxID=6186 RepID=A0A183KIB9_9TREM|nr:unnamed protein product [Schistosoma curassoni]
MFQMNHTDQVHDIKLPDIRCFNDSCIHNEIIYKYVEDISSTSNPGQKSDLILSDVVCPNDSFISSEI